jgi:hypothetical protein
MKTNYYLYLTIVIGIFFALVGCSDSKPHKGSIFVVTQGADNKPLGAVNIYVFNSSDITQRVQDAISAIKSEQVAGLAKYNEALPLYETKLKNYEEERLKFLHDFKRATEEDAKGGINFMWGSVGFSAETLDMYRKPAVEKYPAAEVAWKQSHFSEEMIIEKLMAVLPKPAATTRTDATGSFTIEEKRSQPVVIVAEARRTVAPGNEERYLWIVNIPNAQKDPIILSNHNLAAIPNPDTVASYAEIIKNNPQKPAMPEPLPREIQMIRK